MTYRKAQAFKTLNHWQSTGERSGGFYTTYLADYTAFLLQGAVDDAGDLCLFPWSLKEADAVEGDTWNNSATRDAAFFISPSFSLLFSGKWETADGYDIYYKAYQAGEKIETVPGTVPWDAGDSVTFSYDILEHRNGLLYAHAEDGQQVFSGTHTLTGDYVGKVLLPVVTRYGVRWNFYQKGETPASWCSDCEDRGSTTETLAAYGTTIRKWNVSTIYRLAKLCAQLLPYAGFSEVPHLTGLSPIDVKDKLRTYRWGQIHGGCNADDTGEAPFYRAGTGEGIPFQGKGIPCVATGVAGGTSAGGYSVYQCTVPGSSQTQEQAIPVGACVLAGDFGKTTTGIVYNPLNIAYANHLAPWMYCGGTDDGICTIARRIHEVKVQEGFSFFHD